MRTYAQHTPTKIMFREENLYLFIITSRHTKKWHKTDFYIEVLFSSVYVLEAN